MCISVADMSTGRVGAPLTCCEIRLRDWAEGKTHLDHTNFGRMHLSYLKPGLIFRQQIVSQFLGKLQLACPSHTRSPGFSVLGMDALCMGESFQDYS